MLSAAGQRPKPFDVLLAERPATQIQIAEIEIGLAAARATLGRTGQAIDEWLERPDDEQLQRPHAGVKGNGHGGEATPR